MNQLYQSRKCQLLSHNNLIQLKSEVSWWGIGAHLVAIAWNIHKIDHENFIVDIRMRQSSDNNIFDFLFDDHTIAEHSATNIISNDVLLCCDKFVDSPVLLNGYYNDIDLIKSIRASIKCLKFKEEFISKARSFIPDGKVLGVHYRGTDKHTDIPTIKPYGVCQSVKKKMAEFDHVILCSDDEAAQEIFKKELPSIITFNHVRSPKNSISKFGTPYGLHHSGYGLRHIREAVVEMLALGMCDHIMVARSCFSDAAILYSIDDVTWSYYF